MDGWIDKRMGHGHAGLHAVCPHGSPPDTSQTTMIDRQIDRWVDRWMDGETDAWIMLTQDYMQFVFTDHLLTQHRPQ